MGTAGIRVRVSGGGALGAETAAVGVIDPATTSPTRNATVAARTTPAARNRRLIA
jgi:hypothetical protein